MGEQQGWGGLNWLAGVGFPKTQPFGTSAVPTTSHRILDIWEVKQLARR